MSKTYKMPDKGDIGVLVTAMDQWHKELIAEEINVVLLMVESATGHAITHAGHPVAAKVCIVSVRDHVYTGADAIIEIDAAHWADLTPKQALALIDHELTHLEIQRGAHGEGHTKRWDDGRAKLGARPDDWYLTGFAEVIKRHGDDAIEATALASTIHELSKQQVFNFMREAPAKAGKAPKAGKLKMVSA
jgi:hypothetical protein